MPRPKKLIPSYRKHKASGQAFVEVNGRRFYLGPHGAKASHAEYDRIIAEWLTAGRSASFGTPGEDLTVVELAADYLAFAKGYYGTHSKNSEYYAMLSVLKALTGLYGRTPAVEFGPLQFKTLRQQFIDKGWSRNFINSSAQRVIRFFRWAVGEGKLPPAVPQALAMVPGLRKGKTTARETDPVLPVQDAVLEATLPHLPEVVADMVRLQRLTGMRPAEVCIVRPCDVDRSGEVWIYRPQRHKTAHHGRDRNILIGPKGQDVLTRYLDRGADDYCFRPRESMARWRAARSAARKTPLSCGNRPGTNRRRKPKKSPGDCYVVDAYRRAIARACDQAFLHPTLSRLPRKTLTTEQLETLKRWQSEHRWAPNRLRHAAATEIRREFGLEAAQVMLGHAAADVTQVYAERDLAKGFQVAKAIG